jgi:hypothetical protein
MKRSVNLNIILKNERKQAQDYCSALNQGSRKGHRCHIDHHPVFFRTAQPHHSQYFFFQSSNLAIDKNSKEAFLKKLQLCMKTYDYKDETKDVRGKVS